MGWNGVNGIYLKMAVFWDVTPCNLVEGCRRFGGACFCRLGDDLWLLIFQNGYRNVNFTYEHKVEVIILLNYR
jgi:hypothetical protein